MTSKIDLEDLEYEMAACALEKRRALFWELLRKFPKWRNDLLDFYVALENDC
jgi:hypothetical protein